MKKHTTASLIVAAVSTLAACLHAQDEKKDQPERDLTKALTKEAQEGMTPEEVLGYLKDGNDRFLAGKAIERDFLNQVKDTAAGQFPMATILGCIDSRVPHEIVFDKGVGDIFSARIAGNFVNTDILGSLEFATVVAGSKVVVVLGHTECGAVKGACDHVQLGSLTSTLSNITPAVYSVTEVEGERSSKNKDYVQAVAEKNVKMTVQNTIDRSPTLRNLVQDGKLIVIGAMHDVTTGVVEFYEESMVTAESLKE